MDMTNFAHVVISLIVAAVGLIMRFHSRQLEDRLKRLEKLLQDVADDMAEEADITDSPTPFTRR